MAGAVGLEPGRLYSYDLLDNLGRPSARQILPQFQHLAIGDWVPMGAKTTPYTAYRVARLEPGTLNNTVAQARRAGRAGARQRPIRPAAGHGSAATECEHSLAMRIIRTEPDRIWR